MTMRITGMSSGLDIDSIVKDSLKPYKLKVQKQEQQKQILSWKQEQYQAIMKKATTFYNKYLDPLSSDSLYSISAYNQTKFSSNNENAVSVTGSSSASIQNYTIEDITSIATKATTKVLDTNLASMATGEAGKKYDVSTTIGDQTIELKSAEIGNESVNVALLDTEITNRIQKLTDEYNDAATTSSRKSAIDSSLKALYQSRGQTYSRDSSGTVTITPSSYTTDSLKDIVNNLSAKTATTITASDKNGNSVTSNLYVKLNGIVDTNETITNYNKTSGASNIIAKYSSISKGIVFESRDLGSNEITVKKNDGTTISSGSKAGTNLSAKITNSYGDSQTVTGNKNSVTIDGVTFNFKSTIATGTKVDITGSQDVSGLKTKIVNFVKDYNDLIGTVNGKLWEDYDSDYQPLTDDQRDAMGDSQIEKWEKKAQTGLLRRDDDIISLSDSMKGVMNTLIKTGDTPPTAIYLEKIGIKPVDNYKELNGTFEIDDAKLTAALQNNFEDVKDLFMKNYSADSVKDAGIAPKLRDLMKKEFVSFDSVFNKKAATTGSYALTSEMSKQIADKKNLISDMNKALVKRENDLYSKYSKLEQAMANAQSQQSSMSAWFGSK